MMVAMYEQIKASEQPVAVEGVDEPAVETEQPADEQPAQPQEPGSAE